MRAGSMVFLKIAASYLLDSPIHPPNELFPDRPFKLRAMVRTTGSTERGPK